MAPKRARSKSVPKAPAKAPPRAPGRSPSPLAHEGSGAAAAVAAQAGGEPRPAPAEAAELSEALSSTPSAEKTTSSPAATDVTRMLARRVEHLLRSCLADADASADARVLEIAVLDARQLDGIDPALLAEAEERLAEAREREEAAELGPAGEDPDAVLERLFDAVNDGDAATVAECLDANTGTALQLDVDAADDDGNTPLSEAACYGELEIVELLLERRAHPDRQSRLGRTALWRACYNGHAAVVELLLNSGADKTIANTSGEAPGKYGTPETKSAVLNFDTAATLEIRERLGIRDLHQTFDSAGSKRSSRLAISDAGKCSSSRADFGDGRLVDTLLADKDKEHMREDLARRFQDHTGLGASCPVYPIKIALRDLQVALLTAHHFGKVPLVVCNGLDQPDRFLVYSCECVVDAKRILAEVYFHKTKTLADMQEELKSKLLATMETHGVGLGLHIRMADSACNFKDTFCAPGIFPAEVFGGPSRWNEDAVRLHFDDPCTVIQPDFRIVVSTSFSLEEAVVHLPAALPHYEDMAIIEVDDRPFQ